MVLFECSIFGIIMELVKFKNSGKYRIVGNRLGESDRLSIFVDMPETIENSVDITNQIKTGLCSMNNGVCCISSIIGGPHRLGDNTKQLYLPIELNDKISEIMLLFKTSGFEYVNHM
jgi:hypothetical protein